MIEDREFPSLIKRVERKIHQIELFIHPSLYRPLHNRFHDEFEEIDPYHWPNKNITSVQFRIGQNEFINKLSIRKMQGDRNHYPTYFVVLKNPEVAFQKRLSKIISSEINRNDYLRGIHPNSACCVYYVESPLDFYPKNILSLDKIFEYLVKGLFFKYGRKGEHFIYQYGEPRAQKTHNCPTFYVGKRKKIQDNMKNIDWEINVRNKLHGIRVYYRPIEKSPEYIRLEYVANKDRLKRLGVRSLDNLQNITSDLIRPLDYIIYRKCPKHFPLDPIIRKMKTRGRNEKRSNLKAMTIFHSHKSLISHRCYKIEKDANINPQKWKRKLYDRKAREPRRLLDIVYTVDAFKEIKQRFKLTHSTDYFFPKDLKKLGNLKSMVQY